MKKLLNNISEWTPRLSWAWRQLFAVILPLALAFGLAMGCYKLFGLLFEGFAAEPSQAVLYEVLTIVLAIAAIGIAALGLLAYRLIVSNVQLQVSKSTDTSLKLSRCAHKIDTGLVHWHLYQLSDGKPLPARRVCIEQAIKETRQAFEILSEAIDAEGKDKERLFMTIKNNWAYFIYEKALLCGIEPFESRTALECLEYLECRVSLIPELSEEFMDTIEKVAGLLRPTTS